MSLNKLFLLSVCAVSLCIGIGSPILGSGIDEPLLKKHRTEDRGAVVTVDVVRHSPESDRSTSSRISEYEGEYVHSDHNGIVRITQPKYPTYKGVQGLRLNPKIISELRIDKGNGMPYHLVDFNNLEGPFEGTTRIETIVDSSIPFTIIDSKEAEKKPYSSIGRLEMFFPKGDKESGSSYYGSGAALDRNLVITAAHNFLPPQFNDHPNTGRMRAEEVRFHHMLTTATISNQNSVRSARVSTHCFIHPEWEKNFNPNYDIALVFLSESLKLTQVQIDELLKLKVLNGKEETLRIVGHPNGTIHMSESIGKARWEQAVDSQNIVYHFANTLPGSSGSPIISEDLHIVGTHTTGASEETNGANSGVRMRLELLPFIEDSIKRHQEFLDNMDQIEEFQHKEKQRQEQALIEKGKAEGEIEGQIKLLTRQIRTNKIQLKDIMNDDEIDGDVKEGLKKALQ